ncbi:hypothetical protein V061_02140 [Staphylococcus aureus R0353]|uniref:type II toxin-antitoxin system toxin TscT n=1 Tax=Staphylococcus aureus TaxID=1280 RepID=UPI000446F8E4|nr:DUF1474 family protein [Staphylococcus aureus]EZY62128.1 hypothetical protein V061_02140 [Staphylococcus aureus R0353]EZY82490.1 hypothetical protein V066_00710 [Staphylococcus aureus R0615]
MNWEISNIMCDIEDIKEKINDVATNHGWFINDVFHSNTLNTMEEVNIYGLAYEEHRVHSEQLYDLMRAYLNRFDELIERFHEIERASSFTEQSQDDA